MNVPGEALVLRERPRGARNREKVGRGEDEVS